MTRTQKSQINKRIEDLALSARVSCRRSGRTDIVMVAEEILDRGEARFAGIHDAIEAGHIAWSTFVRIITSKEI